MSWLDVAAPADRAQQLIGMLSALNMPQAARPDSIRAMDRTRAERLEHSRDVVLIVAHTTTFLTELSLFGKLLRERGGAEVVYYCAFTHWTADNFALACERENVTCLLTPLRESLAKSGLDARLTPRALVGPHRAVRMLANRAIGKLPRRFKQIGQSFVTEWLDLGVASAEIQDLYSAVDPKLLVLGGDMPGYDTALYIQIAHERGIPSLIVPSTMSNGLEQAEVYFEDPDYRVSGIGRETIAALYPTWVREHKGRRLLRCPPGRVLAMELAGLAPPQPWVFNSGRANAVAMESQAMVDYYAEAGMKDGRLVLTGSLSDDLLAARLASAASLRNTFCNDLDLDPERPFILTALPPDFLYLPGGRPQCDFQSYEDLVAFWIGSLAELKECNCIVALHPAIPRESMRHIERDNLRIAPGKTSELVPLCDVYVASISSTIRWAIACGKPVVNYDVYRYRYTDFAGVPGVVTIEEQMEFRAILESLARDNDYRQAAAREQSEVAAHWGMIDGRVGDRMLDLATRLAGIRAGVSADV